MSRCSWSSDYGKGRIFHTTMGHDPMALSCVGFITTFQRGTEWAATGRVTQKVPPSFPTAEYGKLPRRHFGDGSGDRSRNLRYRNTRSQAATAADNNLKIDCGYI